MARRQAHRIVSCLALAVLLLPGLAAAGEDGAQPAVACPPMPTPVYVADWGRLAELVRADSLVSSRAEFWASRHQAAQAVVAVGVSVGIGAMALSTASLLVDDAWSRNNTRMVVGGAAVTALAVFAYWAFDPDRDDFVTLINQWNLRHPDRLLAP